MNTLRTIAHGIDRINEGVGKIVSWLTVLMVINVFLVVVLRYLFSVGWIWMQELYVWTHATVFLLGAGYTLLHDGHVRIDLIYRTASVRYQSFVNLIGALLLGLPLVTVIFIKSWPMIERSWANLEKSPEAGGMHGLFILKTVIAVFSIFFGLQLIALILRSIEGLFGVEDKPDYRNADDEEILL